MKGYKGFDKGLTCRGKQYAENTIFEEKNAEVCRRGLHFCENPLDVLDYYPLIGDDGELNEFAEVEALDEVFTDDNRKFCTKKLKIGAKLSLKSFIEASVDGAKLVASGYWAQLAASGNYAQLAASGDGSRLASSGNFAKLVASGDESQLVVSGDESQLAASGDSAKLAASGYWAKLAASGDRAKLASSGDYTQVAVSGENCVAANIGKNGIIKGKKGTWITLAEYMDDMCVCVKSAQIDGKIIKEDTWYKLQNGEFKEAKK